MKEHVLITIMASVGGRYAYAVRAYLCAEHWVVLTVRSQTDIVAVQHVYYNQSYSFLYQWMLVMSTQLIGFSIGGICRAFLVAPPSMSELFCIFIAFHIPNLICLSLAYKSGDLCTIQHATFSRVRWHGQARRLVTRAVLHRLPRSSYNIL